MAFQARRGRAVSGCHRRPWLHRACRPFGPGPDALSQWAELLNKAGFAVLFPDSYGSRNLGPQCRVRERAIHASRERVAVISAARRWLGEQSWVQRDRISLLGWSNGGNGLLWAVRPQTSDPRWRPDFHTAVALYPDCRRNSRLAWSARVPTLILIGAADDWSSARECQQMIDVAKGRRRARPRHCLSRRLPGFRPREPRGRGGARRGRIEGRLGRVHVGTNEAARPGRAERQCRSGSRSRALRSTMSLRRAALGWPYSSLLAGAGK